MAGWLTLMLVIAIAGREATRELSVFQVMLLRSAIGLLLIIPLVRAAGGLAALRTQRLRDHALRNIVHYAAQYGWFAALTMIPLAQVVAIEFTMPIWTVLLAAIFLGERITAAKMVAVVLGLVGGALVVGPGGAGGMGSIAAGQFVGLDVRRPGTQVEAAGVRVIETALDGGILEGLRNAAETVVAGKTQVGRDAVRAVPGRRQGRHAGNPHQHQRRYDFFHARFLRP